MALNFDSRYFIEPQNRLMSKLDMALEKEDLSKAKELFLEWHSYLINFLDRVKRVSENDNEKETFLKMNNALSESIDLFLSYVDLIT